MTREREGLLLCLVSAAGFGAMPIFAKQAYAEGLELTPLLALRFAIAAAMLWALIALRRRALGSLRGLAAGAALGLFGYSVQAGLYFGALERIDAGLASLLLYAYPAFVTVAAIALRRESPSRRKLGALGLASGGVALVLLGGGPDDDRPAGRRHGGRLGALLHGLHPRLRPRGRAHAARAVRRQRRHRRRGDVRGRGAARAAASARRARA